MITTYGSGTTTIPAAVAPSNASADIIAYVPSNATGQGSVNGLGFQDHNRGGIVLYSGMLASSATSHVEVPNLPVGIRGFILDINALYDGALSLSGVEIFAFYSSNNGSSYSTSELVATVSGRVIQSRVYVAYRAASITNEQFTFTNIDTQYPCKSLNVTASIYR